MARYNQLSHFTFISKFFFNGHSIIQMKYKIYKKMLNIRKYLKLSKKKKNIKNASYL